MSLLPTKREPVRLFDDPLWILGDRKAEGVAGALVGAGLGAVAFRAGGPVASASGAVLGGLVGVIGAMIVRTALDGPLRSSASEVDLQAGDPGPTEGVV